MSRLGQGALAATLGALYVVVFVGAVTANVGVLLFAVLAGYLVDALLQRVCAGWLLRVLDRVSAGPSWRCFVRQTLILVLLFRTNALSPVSLAIVVAAVLAHHLMLVAHSTLGVLIGSRRMRRLETRNLAVPGASLPPPPGRWLLHDGSTVLLHADLLLVAALGWAFVTGSYRLVAPAAVLMVVLATAVPLCLAEQVRALLRLPGDEARMRAAQQAVLELRPLVVLYFSGGIASVYQVNMWLETMERLDRRVLVLLRERRYLDHLAATTLPVLCLPFAADVMNFRMPSARVALYVANVGKNIHLLRAPALKSAFIGHGDSDKTASFNPATKVYHQVWVAGEAGRGRYLRARVGVRDEEIVVVGRPQLDGIREAVERPEGAPFTVLYAPTLEGWTDDPYQSSLITLGLQIVRILLESPAVRVVYKPHPLTGSVNPEAQRVSDEIVSLLNSAGADHEAVLHNAKPLYDCFNESDAMISDISSVVSDYLRSEKPYFVTNASGLPDAAFRELNPSAEAAYLVGPGAAGLREGLAEARGADEFGERRAVVRAHLLGGPGHEPMTLFRKAVDELAAQADAHLSAVGPGGAGDDTGMEPSAAGGAESGRTMSDVGVSTERG